jgi:hypothetical protein
MATTTPNFGWPVPTSTDLVKDGATAIESLGDSIDASLLDLKGGTSGQVLSKNSNTDMDFTWVTSDDANAIQNAIVDAKGDLIAATAADTPARLAVGTNGQVLTADSTAATGLKWSSVSPTFVGCSLRKTAAQTTSAATYTVITFTAEDIDTNGFHDNSTNTSRITIPTGYAGKYLITAQLSTNNGDQTHTSAIKKNGANYNTFPSGKSAQSGAGCSSNTLIMDLAVGDYVEISQYSSGGVQVDSTAQNDRPTVFACQWLGA